MGFEILFQWLFDKIEQIKFFKFVRPDEGGVILRYVPFAPLINRLFKGVSSTGLIVLDTRPGVMWKVPFCDQFNLLPTKRQSVDLDNIRVLSRQGTKWLVSCTLTYEVHNPRKAILETENFDDSLVVTAMATVARWVNRQMDSELTIDKLIEACYPEVREKGFQWGCKISELGVNSMSPHFMLSHVVTQEGS